MCKLCGVFNFKSLEFRNVRLGNYIKKRVYLHDKNNAMKVNLLLGRLGG